jgi:hypothetical protein
MKIEKPTVLLKRNHYIKCFCFIQNVANKNINICLCCFSAFILLFFFKKKIWGRRCRFFFLYIAFQILYVFLPDISVHCALIEFAFI